VAFVLQDYQLFFDAVECEELFKFLHIDAPQNEVEYIIKNAPKEEEVGIGLFCRLL